MASTTAINEVDKRMNGILASIPPSCTKHEAALYIMERCATTSPPPRQNVVQALQTVLQCTVEQAEYFYGAVRTRFISDSD